MSVLDSIRAQAVTLYRETEIRFRVPEYLVVRHPWSATRSFGDVSPGPNARTGHSQNVLLLPSGAWVAQSDQMRQRWDLTTSIPFLHSIDTLQVPANFAEFAAFGKIPGVTYGGGVGATGNIFTRKTVPASASDWSANLSADQTAFPEPEYADSDVTIERVAKSGGETPVVVGENCPTYLRFVGPPNALLGYGAMCTWFVGGTVGATAYPAGHVGPQGGEFAISLYGDGIANLFERTLPDPGDATSPDPTHPWRFLASFQWANVGEIASRHHMLVAIPEGPHTLTILSSGPSGSPFGPDSHGFRFVASQSVCAYNSKNTMTGAGPVRLSMRQDLRCPFQLGDFVYDVDESHNVVVSHPFTLSMPVPADTVLTLVAYADTPELSAIVGTLWDPDTQSQLAAGDPSGLANVTNWKTVDGQQTYYARFELSPSGTSSAHSTSNLSPFLYGFTVSMDGVQELSDAEPFTGDTDLGGGTMQWNTAGQDTEPASASAHILIDDVHDFLTTDEDVNPNGGLDVHADIRTQIRTKYKDDPSDPARLIIFDGILLRAPATFHPILGYPSRNIYNCQIAGMWARLAQANQTLWVQQFLATDPADPTSGRKITDVVRDLLFAAGFPDEQIGIPDLPIRFFMTDKNKQDFVLSVGARLCDLIDHLLKRYLRGAALHWEPNAGVNQRGMWHVLQPPFFRGDGLYDYRWHWRMTEPSVSPGSVYAIHSPAVWGEKTTFIESLDTWPEKPETSWWEVLAGEVISNQPQALDVPTQIVKKVIFNPRAAQAENFPAVDKSHLDYSGFFKRAVYVDSLLWIPGDRAATEHNVEFVARGLLDATGYGKRHFVWESPLFGVFDASDTNLYDRPRLPRTYDLCTVENRKGQDVPVMITCVSSRGENPAGDLHQLNALEGFEVPVPIGAEA